MRLRRLYAIGPACVALAATHVATVAPGPQLTRQQVDGHRRGVPPARRATSPAATAFVDVAVVPMDREVVLQHQTVLVRDGRIAALGPVARVAVPAGATRIDGRGKFLIPGLADMHAHLALGSSGTHMSHGGYAPPTDSAGADAKLFLWLANGVTTIRDLDYGSEVQGKEMLRLRARAAAGQSWIPRIYTAGKWGPSNYLSPSGPKPILDSIPAYVAAYKAAGFDLVKVHDEDSLTLITLAVELKRVGLPLVGHVPPPVRVERALTLGYKSIEHPFTSYLWGGRTRPFSGDTSGFGTLAAALRRANVWHCPTQSHYNWLHDDPVNLVKVEQDSGVKLLLGTDELPWIGVIASELQAFVAAGVTPYQALLTGTRNIAEYFGTLEQSGTVAVGKRADLVLLPGNPLADVRYTAQPAGVMLGGRWLPRDEIDRRVASLTLPAVDSTGRRVRSLPVRSYWSNIAEQTGAQAMSVPAGIGLSDEDEWEVTSTNKDRWVQQQALADSLGASTDYAAGTRRVLGLVAQQLGTVRAALSAAGQAKFDARAKHWLARRRAEGYTGSIPGVQ